MKYILIILLFSSCVVVKPDAHICNREPGNLVYIDTANNIPQAITLMFDSSSTGIFKEKIWGDTLILPDQCKHLIIIETAMYCPDRDCNTRTCHNCGKKLN